MSGKPIPRLLWDQNGEIQKGGRPPADPYDAPPLWEFLWRRRGTIAISTVGCLLITVVYLLFATRVYRAESRLDVEQNAPHVFSENHTERASVRHVSLYPGATVAVRAGPSLRVGRGGFSPFENLRKSEWRSS